MKLLPDLTHIRGHAVWTPSLGPDSVVVDAGAHKGEFSHTLHQNYGCRCILVEANPYLARKLAAPEGGAVVGAALSATDGESNFVFRDNLEGGGIAPRLNDSGNEKVTINTISLSTLRQSYGLDRLDLLKLDIEGAEFPLLEKTPESDLADIGQITVEFHDFLPDFHGRGLFESAKARLEELGFVCLPMAFRTHGDVLFLNRRQAGLSTIAVWKLATFGRWVLKLRAKREARV